ncbi:MAG TPA: murein biosynthesis integral membrane protein MurJ [Chloroflexota bacterium]|nr:murein biosynthesis integral membrane protein MurJ [Chloroflexota bacterium]
MAKAAGLIMAGQVASRLLGFARDAVTAALFGQTGATDAFFAAQTVSQTVYDLLVGTTITAALIPIFSEHADEDDLGELWRIASVVITLGALLLSGLAALMVVFAPQVMGVTVQFKDTTNQQLAIDLARMVMPSLVFLGLSGILQSLLYSMRNFLYSAFCVAAFNGAVVASAILFHAQLGVASLTAGMVAGSLIMVLLQLPPLIQTRMRFRPSLDLNHPEIRRIGKLYLPVAAGMVVTIAGIIVDRHLASLTGAGNLSAMQYATKIVQLPLGLISTALGVAILPTLSRHALEPGLEQYKAVLSRGLKFVLALILPMTVGVLVLNHQILGVVYQHGQYTAADRQVTALALYLYAPELPFAAIDYLLIAAFYALKNTLVPAAIGVVGVGIYLAVALPLVGALGFPALVIANTLKDSLHGIILLVLLWRLLGGLQGYTLPESALKMLLAGAAMAVVALGCASAVGAVTSLSTFSGQVAQLAIAGGAGLAAYVGAAAALKVDEVHMVWNVIAARVRAEGT